MTQTDRGLSQRFVHCAAQEPHFDIFRPPPPRGARPARGGERPAGGGGAGGWVGQQTLLGRAAAAAACLNDTGSIALHELCVQQPRVVRLTRPPAWLLSLPYTACSPLLSGVAASSARRIPSRAGFHRRPDSLTGSRCGRGSPLERRAVCVRAACGRAICHHRALASPTGVRPRAGCVEAPPPSRRSSLPRRPRRAPGPGLLPSRGPATRARAQPL